MLGWCRGSYDKAKSVEDSLSKDLVRLTTVWKNKEEALKKEEASLKAAHKATATGAAAVDSQREAIAAVEAELAAANESLNAKVRHKPSWSSPPSLCEPSRSPADLDFSSNKYSGRRAGSANATLVC